MIYYTADLHFGHEANLGKSARPFLTVDDMEVILVKNWNEVVGKNDTVYILGDFISRSRYSPAHYLDQLNGKKHLIIGNHDIPWMKSCNLQKYFESVGQFAETRDGGKRIVMSHFPMVEWYGSKRGSILLYGHVHNRKENPTYQILRSLKHAYNAGVDIQKFEPVPLGLLIQNHKKFYGV